MVVFDLQNGRRKEPLREHQVANAANVQMAVDTTRSWPSSLAAAQDMQPLGSFGHVAAARRPSWPGRCRSSGGGASATSR